MESEIDNIRRYPIELFIKYRDFNRSMPDFLEPYKIDMGYIASHHGAKNLKPSENLNDTEIRNNLNYLINKKNNTNVDEELYDKLQKQLNKITVKNFSEITGEILSLPYSKTKHIYRLAESIIVKSIREPMNNKLYVNLCFELLGYYVESKDNKILFRNVLLIICQDIFDELTTFVKKGDKVITREVKKGDYERGVSYDTLELSGLCRFLGELYNKNIITHNITNICFAKLYSLENNQKYNECISNLFINSAKELKMNDSKFHGEILTKLKLRLSQDCFLTKDAKFIIMDTIEALN